MPRPGLKRTRRSLPNTPGRSRHAVRASTQCQMTSVQWSETDWPKPTGENSCRTISSPRLTNATADENTLHAPGVLRSRANIRVFERAICQRRQECSGKHSHGGGDHPDSGYQTDDPDVRVIFVTRYPYKIFYRVRDAVEILHIRHT